MKKMNQKNKQAVVLATVCLLIAGISFSFQDSPNINLLQGKPMQKDTVPDKKDRGMTMKEFENLSDVLDKSLLEVSEDIKKIDLDKALQSAELSLQAIDMEKMLKEVERSLAQTDFRKITAEALSAVNEEEWSNHKTEIEKAMKEAQKEMEQAKEEMKKINVTEIKKEMEQARKEMMKSRDELKKIDFHNIINDAKAEVEKAKSSIKELQTMFDEMEADGLIKKKDGFTIEYLNNDLFINGEKKSSDITGKYRKYFKEDHFKINIEKEKQ
ncbi:MAG: hypothetical protein JST81_12540 [Bacteroidetes bacterium]|nr:hypothetical protein [Bacteroidota bacterium]